MGTCMHLACLTCTAITLHLVDYSSSLCSVSPVVCIRSRKCPTTTVDDEWRKIQRVHRAHNTQTPCTCTSCSRFLRFSASIAPDAGQDVIDELHEKGRGVVCYISIGTVEDWREDKDQFPSEAIGSNLDDWEGEKWLDVNNDQVRNIMSARVQKAASMNCDAVVSE